MKIFSESKNLIAMFILGLVIIAAIVFLARPLINQCLTIYKENKDKRTEIESYDQNLNNLKSIEPQIEDINYTITKANQFIPAEENINDFIVQLEGAVKESKISLTSIKLEEENKSQSSVSTEDNENASTQDQSASNDSSSDSQKSSKIINVSGTNEVAIKVEVQGKYSRLVSFLGRMKQLSRFNIIKNLSFQSSGEDTTITGSFYVIIFNRG